MVDRLGGVAVTFRVEPALAHLAAPGPAYDLIFLDGDHNAVPVYHEVAAALRRLAPGGVILLHDFFPGARPIWAGAKVIPGPWLAAERLRRELGGFAVLPLGELPWPTRDGTCITNLALVAAA
jgi:predicted O-methyltransferase YrrM